MKNKRHIEVSEKRWPILPQKCLIGLAGEVVNLIAPQSESDPAALLIQFLTFFGNSVGPKPHFRIESTKHHANLFSIIVGQTAKSRKGTSFDNIKAIFERACPVWNERCRATGLSSGEGLIYAVGTAKAKNEPAAKRLLVFEPEFAKVLRVQFRQGNTLSATLRNAWDGTVMQILTKNNPVRVTGAHVSLVGHVTVDELKRELFDVEQGNGYANRMLFVCARRSRKLPEGGYIGETKLAHIAKQVAAARKFAHNVDEVKRSTKARRLWAKWYNALPESPGMLGAMTARAEAQVVRLSMIFALLNKSKVVRTQHLKAAIAVWNYCEASVRHIFGTVVGDKIADRIYNALLDAKSEGMSRSDIRELFSRNLSEEQISRALDLLLEASFARRKTIPTKGRPEERWFSA